MPSWNAIACAAIALRLAAPGCARAQTAPATTALPLPEALTRIRDLGMNHSQVMDIAFQITDAVGPRLTNSPGIRAAQAHALDLLRVWGVKADLEPWRPFGPSWSVIGSTSEMLSPAYTPLIAYAKAWSPGTGGVIEGEPVYLDAASAADLDKYRGHLGGRIVLAAAPRGFPDQPAPVRWSGAALLDLAGAPAGMPEYTATAAQRAAVAVYAAQWALLQAEHPALVLEPGAGEGGTVNVTSTAVAPASDGSFPNPWEPGVTAILPQMVLAAEQYNRIVRLVGAGQPVRLRSSLAVESQAGIQPANIIAELPGNVPGEVVMFGGCFDSWHTATGATDNASGAAAALETMRILASLPRPTRRTIRLALWSGEEQGRLGSRAWVDANLGSHDRPTPASAGLAAYFNLDWGPGKIRGVYLQGNRGADPLLRAALAPFADLDAATLTLRSIGASDHISFDDAGVPGFSFIRDFMETGIGPHHTNMDVYDRLLPDDLRQVAVVTAGLVYTLAQQSEPFPRQ